MWSATDSYERIPYLGYRFGTVVIKYQLQNWGYRNVP